MTGMPPTLMCPGVLVFSCHAISTATRLGAKRNVTPADLEFSPSSASDISFLGTGRGYVMFRYVISYSRFAITLQSDQIVQYRSELIPMLYKAHLGRGPPYAELNLSRIVSIRSERT